MNKNYVVALYDDYVQDLPEKLKDRVLKNLNSEEYDINNASSQKGYVYIYANTINLMEQFIKVQAFVNSPEAENDVIELYLPSASIKAIFEKIV